MVELIWKSIQRAEIVVVDFSAQSVNVGIEMGWAMGIGKKLVVITQDEKNIPTDLRGLYRYLPYSESFFDMQKLDNELSNQLVALREEPAEEMAAVAFDGYNITKAPGHVHGREGVRYGQDRGRLVRGDHRADSTTPGTSADLTKRLRPGDRLDGSFVVDLETKKPRYTLLRPEDNPWPTIASRYPIGSEFSNVVVATNENAGAWVACLAA